VFEIGNLVLDGEVIVTDLYSSLEGQRETDRQRERERAREREDQ
jgi:hypothetical protein